MKYTSIVVAALISCSQAGIRLTRIDGSITDLPDNLYLQVEESKIEEKDGKVVYHPGYDGFEGNKGTFGEWREPYERVVPETSDTFTKKMIKDYAIEVADEDTGLPTGKFIVSKDATKKAAVEVLGTHLGLYGADAQAHLSKYFEMVWNHFDVLNKGSLEANELNHLMRDLANQSSHSSTSNEQLSWYYG